MICLAAVATAIKPDEHWRSMVIPETGPGDERTAHLVDELRETAVDGSGDGATLGVTGLTAVMIDMTEKMAEVFPIYIAIIVILSMIILLFAFRSVLLPILATGGFVLSILATLGHPETIQTGDGFREGAGSILRVGIPSNTGRSCFIGRSESTSLRIHGKLFFLQPGPSTLLRLGSASLRIAQDRLEGLKYR